MEITPNAIEQLKKMIASVNAPHSGIRISVIPGCCSPKPLMSVEEKAEEGEKIITVDSIDLFMDITTEKAISGYIIDFNSNGFKLDYMLPPGRCCR